MEIDETNIPTVISSLVAAAYYYMAAIEEENKTLNKSKTAKKRKRLWIKSWRLDKEKESFLVRELSCENDSIKSYLRMNEECFCKIQRFIEKDVRKEDTIMRKAVPVADKLAATLRYLATGETLLSLNFRTKLSNSFLETATIDVCEAIYKNMQSTYLKFPDTPSEWEAIAENFEAKWQFPHCLGALDGRHIAFKASVKDAAKGFNTIAIIALADADSKFTFVDIGCNGPINDSDVLSRSDLIRNAENIFPADEVVGNNRLLPFVIISDDTFPLQRYIMTPFPYESTEDRKKAFNARLSHARQTIERTFYILASRFRILQTQINLNATKAKIIVQTCCVLHNFLLEHSPSYRDVQRNDMQSQQMARPDNNQLDISKKTSESIRDAFADYFINEGKETWQEHKLTK